MRLCTCFSQRLSSLVVHFTLSLSFSILPTYALSLIFLFFSEVYAYRNRLIRGRLRKVGIGKLSIYSIYFSLSLYIYTVGTYM